MLPATYRELSGLLVAWQTRKVIGPFCRGCGLALGRQATAHTLSLGLFGFPACVIAPVYVTQNLTQLRRFHALTPPTPMPGSDPTRYRPLHPGPPLLARAPVYCAPLAVVLFALVAWMAAVAPPVDPLTFLGSYDIVGASDLHIGDCIDTIPGDVTQVEKVACEEMHDAEVFAAFPVDEGPFGSMPGEGQIASRAMVACQDAFEPYVGDSRFRPLLEMGFIAPSRDAWSAGARRGYCAAFPRVGPELVEPIRGSRPQTS